MKPAQIKPETLLLDYETRLRALNPQESFIVEAPAGSGKTNLLVKRFLALLATVKHPSQVLAITFTRKAAHEMKERIKAAIMLDDSDEDPQDAVLRASVLSLRQQALRQKWDLLDLSHQLQVMTIDAFCHMLLNQAPLESQILTASLIEDESALRQDFLSHLLQLIADEEPGWADFVRLFQYFDNQLLKVRDLLFDLLKSRQEWLPIILHAGQKENVQNLQNACIRALQEEAAAQFYRLEPAAYRDTLLAWVGGQLEKLPALLLTQKGQWRKSFTAQLGLERDQKQIYLEILDFLSSQEEGAWHDVIQSLGALPTVDAESDSILPVLLRVLPLAAAHFHVLLEQKQCMDFNDIALKAVSLLEDEEAGLSERVSASIRHILIDEFQDTSNLQFRLLSALAQNWSQEEGRSIFLVGDPKQSIYRFRHANVGLFLKAQEEGVAGMKLTSLHLLQNFRTDQRLMGFINTACQAFFPKQADAQLGRIPYFSSQPFQEYQAYEGVHSYWTSHEEDEAGYIISEIQRLIQKEEKSSIAILVRARSHFQFLIPKMKAAGLSFFVKADQSWLNSSRLEDIISLIYALSHEGDRLAWLAVLRSPLCGLLKPDLLAIAQYQSGLTIWQSMRSAVETPYLSEDGQARVFHLLLKLYPVMAENQRDLPLYLKLKQIAEPIYAGIILNRVLYFISQQKRLPFFQDFKRLLSESTQPGELPSSNQIELLTIHQSKGLEFDYVFLPGLHKNIMQSDSPILLSEVFYLQHQFQFLLAERGSAAAGHSSSYHYLKWLEAQRSQQESIRLLYVAFTRAKQGLWLSGGEKAGSNSFLKALSVVEIPGLFGRNQLGDTISPAQSMLEKDSDLKPQPAQVIVRPILSQQQRLEDREQIAQLQLALKNREAEAESLAIHGALPSLFLEECSENRIHAASQFELDLLSAEIGLASLEHSPSANLTQIGNQYQRRSKSASLVGENSVCLEENQGFALLGEYIHAYLEVRGKGGSGMKYHQGQFIRNYFLDHGLPLEYLPSFLSEVFRIFKKLEQSQHLPWILAPHEQAESEWSLSFINEEGHLEKGVLDRCFLENNTRFILDYKVTQERPVLRPAYREQLLRYRNMVQRWDSTFPIRVGLYFVCQDTLLWLEES